jgi:hypothetical protein
MRGKRYSNQDHPDPARALPPECGFNEEELREISRRRKKERENFAKLAACPGPHYFEPRELMPMYLYCKICGGRVHPLEGEGYNQGVKDAQKARSTRADIDKVSDDNPDGAVLGGVPLDG